MEVLKRCLSFILVVTIILSKTLIAAPIKTHAASINEIENPSFETGDLTGWTVIEGDAFSDSNVSNATTWWDEQITYNKAGDFHLDGWGGAGEPGTGILRSSTFNLSGSGFISFRLGGAKNKDLVNIEVYNADTGKQLATYGNTEFSDTGFPKVENGLRLANMVLYKADLSSHIGENLYIQLVDKATSDWGLMFADEFNTYYESEPQDGIVARNLYKVEYANTIENPSFETGDLTGWTVIEGDAFSETNVSDATTWWAEQITYNKAGDYHLDGWGGAGEPGTGILRSSTFNLSGSGFISFRLGGAKNRDLVNIEVYNADTGKQLATYGNTEFSDTGFPRVENGLRLANMVVYKADLSSHIGENIYIQLVDKATSDWGVIFADEFNTYYEVEPEEGVSAKNLFKVEYANSIENPSFETGDLTGWIVKDGDAFSNLNISADTTWWQEAITYNKEGVYHLDGWQGAGEAGTGKLRSSIFTLGGSGYITFRLGGAKNYASTYIQVVNETSGEVVAKYGNLEFADINFPSVENGMRLANMVEYKANLSEYLGENLYIEIVDNATSDWGVMFVDEINTFNETEPQGKILAKNIYYSDNGGGTANSIYNNNFEIPDLTGWEQNNDVFKQSKDQIEGKEADNFLESSTEKVGDIKSNQFKLSGTGKISVLIGGEGNIENLYVGFYLSKTDELIYRINATNSKTLSEIKADLSAYLSQEMYVKVVDNDNQGYILVDNIDVYTRGVIADWNFDENTGKYAQDSVSSKNDFIEYVFNNAVYTKPQDPQWRGKGIKGSALLFDGFSSFIKRDNSNIEQPTDQLTIEAWVAPRVYEWGDGQKLSAIVSQYDKNKNEGYILGMYRHGIWSLQLGINGKWVEVFCNDKPLEKYKWNYVTATFNKADSKVKLYLNGTLVKEQTTPLNKGITPSSEDLLIGKNNYSVNLATVFNYNMFSGLMDEIKIHNVALSDEEVALKYSDYTNGTNIVPELAKEDIEVDESVYEGDKDRPQYHAIPPGNWMNESHAPIYYNGMYHLFYQSNPQGPYWHQIHWGHWVSEDMVHWKNVLPALAPEAGALDPDGIWSGSAAYDRAGKPVLFYTAGNDSASPNQGVAMATPADLNDKNLEAWDKYPQLVISQKSGEGVFGEFRDPFVWYDKEEDKWFCLVTSGRDDRAQGTALVYTSDDMKIWIYHGHLMDEDVSSYTNLGTVWELPVLLSIGKDENNKEKYAFFVTPCRNQADVEVNYWIGTFDKGKCKFIPDFTEPKSLDLGDGHLTAQCGFKTPDGRTVLYSIVQNMRTPQAEFESGWAHTNSLPIELKLKDGDLEIQPIQELNSLRLEKLADINNMTLEETNENIKNVKGDMLEIMVEFENIKDAQKFGISVRKSPNDLEQTDLYYDVDKGGFYVDRNKTSLDPDVRSYGVQGGKVEMKGNKVKLHIYLDRSIIECFVNNTKKLTTRVYPLRYDSLGLELFSDKDIKIKSMQIWNLDAMDGSVEPVYEQPNWDTTQYENCIPLFNHDFASGDLSGWTSDGNAFSDANVTTQEKFWDTIYFNPSRRLPGGHHLWGFNESAGGDTITGTLKSQEFILGGKGKVDFLVSGGKDIDNLYVALVRSSDGKELFKQTGFNYEEYIRVRWDASQYLGETLYFKVVDNSTNGFGHINVDDFNVLTACKDLDVENFKESLEINESMDLAVKAIDGINENDVSKDVSIEALDDSIIQVDGLKLTGMKAGTTEINIKYGNTIKKLNVKVGNTAKELIVENYKDKIKVGEKLSLAVKLSDGSEAKDISSKVNVKVEDQNIASVNGVDITGLRLGSTKIIVEYGDLVKKIPFTVNSVKPDISCNETLYIGGTVDNMVNLGIDFTPYLTDTVQNNDIKVSYVSSKENIATVSDVGIVTGLNIGKTVITTKIEFLDGTIEILSTDIVVKRATIKYETSKIIMRMGEKKTIKVKLYGFQPDDISWCMKKKGIINISIINGKSSAVVTATRRGTDLLVVKAGKVKATKTICVK